MDCPRHGVSLGAATATKRADGREFDLHWCGQCHGYLKASYRLRYRSREREMTIGPRHEQYDNELGGFQTVMVIEEWEEREHVPFVTLPRGDSLFGEPRERHAA